MAIKDAWRFDKSQWALKAGIASALVLATIAWYALECGPVFPIHAINATCHRASAVSRRWIHAGCFRR